MLKQNILTLVTVIFYESQTQGEQILFQICLKTTLYDIVYHGQKLTGMTSVRPCQVWFYPGCIPQDFSNQSQYYSYWIFESFRGEITLCVGHSKWNAEKLIELPQWLICPGRHLSKCNHSLVIQWKTLQDHWSEMLKVLYLLPISFKL